MEEMEMEEKKMEEKEMEEEEMEEMEMEEKKMEEKEMEEEEMEEKEMEEDEMKEDFISSSSELSETKFSPELGGLKKALKIFDACSDREKEKQFLKPRGVRGITLAHLAAYRGNVDILKRAAARGDNLYALDTYDRSALYHAAEQGHINVLKWLMDQPAAHEERSERTSSTGDQASLSDFSSNTTLHRDVETGYVHPPIEEQSEGDNLSRRSSRNFDKQDKLNGWTPLHAAVYGGHLDCVRFLIEKGLCLANATKTGVTVIDAILYQIPLPVAFLEEILDKQVSMADKSGQKVNLDFTILTALPNYARVPEAKSTSIEQLFVVLTLVNAVRNTAENLKILEHPLVATFIQQKFLFTTPFYLFILFCDLCNAIVLYQYYTYTKTRIGENIIIPISFSLQLLGITLNAVTILITLLDFVASRRNEVLRNLFSRHLYTNRVHKAFAIGRLVLMTAMLYLIVSCTYGCSVTSSKTHRVIMSSGYWFGHTLTAFSLLPFVGLYIFMFLVVLRNVLKVLAIFSFLIVGFSITFGLLFSDNDQFSTPWKALGKTLVMMTGEYDYDNLFSSTNKTDDTEQLVTSATIFFIFLIVIGIVLMNLMTGLAVDDVRQLLKKGYHRWLGYRVQLGFQWFWLYYFMNWVLTKCKNGEQTEELTRTVLLDLKSESSIPWRRLPKNVKSALLELALKNSSNRDEKSEVDLLRDDIQKSLTALQTIMLAESRFIQSSLRGVVVEQQLQNCQIQQLTQDRMTKRQRKS